MEKQPPSLIVPRIFGVAMGIALLLVTALFVPFIYIIGLLVVFRAEHFLSERSSRSRLLYQLWIGLLGLCVFTALLSLVKVSLRIY